jgi:hypothetical protein
MGVISRPWAGLGMTPDLSVRRRDYPHPALFVWLAARKTQGDWRLRWGD